MLTVINEDRENRAYQDEAGKIYRPVSAITHALTGRDPFAFVDEDTLEAAILFGNKAHRLFATLLASMQGLCDAPAVNFEDERLYYAHAAMLKWVNDTGFKPRWVEQASKNDRYGIAGTPDCDGWYGKKQILTIPDLKTGTVQPEHKVQVMLYRFLEGYEKARQLLILYIDGRTTDYKEVIVYPDAATEIAALSMAAVLNWRANHGY
jgi:hypothetical protein